MRSVVLVMAGLACSTVWAGDHPFFVTYTTDLEETGALEIANKSVAGKPDDGNAFLGGLLELEYGAKPWWTTEFYLDGQTTRNESTTFTGFRWENRFRVFAHPRWYKPVLYIEYENLSGDDKTLLEVVGHDTFEEFNEPVGEARLETEQELETKLLFTGHIRGWSISENFIGEKVLNAKSTWEFGYAAGAFRPLNFRNGTGRKQQALIGVEAYGGIGTATSFGFHDTSHYIAPTIAWDLGHGLLVKASPNFGLNGRSAGFLMRFGVTTEIDDFGRALQELFR